MYLYFYTHESVDEPDLHIAITDVPLPTMALRAFAQDARDKGYKRVGMVERDSFSFKTLASIIDADHFELKEYLTEYEQASTEFLGTGGSDALGDSSNNAEHNSKIKRRNHDL